MASGLKIDGLAMFYDVLGPAELYDMEWDLNRMENLARKHVPDGLRVFESKNNTRYPQRQGVMYLGLRHDYQTHKPAADNCFPYDFPIGAVPNALRKMGTIVPTLHFGQCLVNKYNVGDCCPPHVDSLEYGDVILVYSGCTQQQIWFDKKGSIKPKNPTTERGKFTPTKGTVMIDLPVNSVLLLSGKARYAYEHCIPAVSDNRYSLTFRTVNEGMYQVNRSERLRHVLQQHSGWNTT